MGNSEGLEKRINELINGRKVTAVTVVDMKHFSLHSSFYLQCVCVCARARACVQLQTYRKSTGT